MSKDGRHRHALLWWQRLALVAWLFALLLAPTPAAYGATAQSEPTCGFALGFASLRHQIIEVEDADTVGACLEDEYHAVSGDGVQWTANGLFVWRKATNWTGFTDGQSTWVGGPAGVAKRSNSERFPWERTGLPDAVGALSNPSSIPPAPMEVDEVIRQVFVLHAANGGSTFNPHFGDLGGYGLFAVSVYPDRSEVVLGKLVPLDALREFVVDNRDLLEDPRVSIGTWHNEEDGTTYLDISATVPDRQLAIELGQKYNQIAIFDLASFEEIPTGGTGESVLDLPHPQDRLPPMGESAR